MKIRVKKSAPGVLPVGSQESIALDEFLSFSAKKPRGGREKKVSKLEELIQEAERRSHEGDWEEATGRSFVGLYALCHRLVYKVDPAELEVRGNLMVAARMAGSRLHDDFGDDVSEMVEFIKWAWKRQEKKIEHAASRGGTANRLSPTILFSKEKITDYRVDHSSRITPRRVG